MSGSTYRMLLTYDGSAYRGWQFQGGVPTVEGQLRSALGGLTGESVAFTAAGRTDRGVHAHGQVVAMTLSRPYPVDTLRSATNARLPEDIRVLRVESAPAGFHPRFAAWRRTYRYLVRVGAGQAPVGRQYVWDVSQPLELAPMRRGAALLLGSHDFGAFGTSPQPGGHSVRTIDRLSLRASGVLLTIEVRADAFLRGMMRRLAGALVEVGRGRMSPDRLVGFLEQPRAAQVAAMAPARGLHQWRVEYRSPSGSLG